MKNGNFFQIIWLFVFVIVRLRAMLFPAFYILSSTMILKIISDDHKAEYLIDGANIHV